MTQPPSRDANPVPLYSTACIVLATTLGSVLAGGHLIAANFMRLGNKRAAVVTWAVAVVGAVVLFGSTFILPESVPAAVFLAPQIALAYYLPRRLFEAEFSEIESMGGRFVSKWRAAGVGVSWLAVVAVVLAVGIFVDVSGQDPGRLVETPGRKGEVYVRGEASDQDAAALLTAIELRWFLKSDADYTVILDKSAGETKIGFVVKDGAWNDPMILVAFGTIAADAAPAVGGLPVTVQLLDDSYRERARRVIAAP